MKNLGLRYFGPAAMRRWAIVDEDEQLWWTGSDWCPDRRRALLYARFPEIAAEYHRLDVEQLAGRPCRTFQATVTVRVWADADFTLKSLGDFLAATTSLHIDPTTARGTGPVEGSVVRVDISWGTLRRQ